MGPVEFRLKNINEEAIRPQAAVQQPGIRDC